MSGTESFDDLMARLRLGDGAAATDLHRRFVWRLVALAHRQFDTWFRAKADPEDVVQSAFLSFFERHARGEFHLSCWDSLWALLALITVRKCRDRRKRLAARRRDVAHERSWDDPADPALPDDEPTPEEAAMLGE